MMKKVTLSHPSLFSKNRSAQAQTSASPLLLRWQQSGISNGLQDIIGAVDYTCAPRERGCRRLSAEHVHFRGTKYETRVDVGQCIRRCRVHGESWIMLLESFRFEDEDEIYLEVFLGSILKNYTLSENYIILLSRWYSRLPITRTLANSNQNRYQFQDWGTRINSAVRPVP